MKNILILTLLGFLFGCGGSSSVSNNESSESSESSENCMDSSEWELYLTSQDVEYFGWVNGMERCSPSWGSDLSIELAKNEVYEYSNYSNENQEISTISTTTTDDGDNRSSYIKISPADSTHEDVYYEISSKVVVSSELDTFSFYVEEGDNYWTGQPLLTISYPDGTSLRCDGTDGDTMVCENGFEVKHSDVIALLTPDESGQYIYDYGTRLMNILNLSF